MDELLANVIINENDIKLNLEKDIADELSLFFINSNLDTEQRINLLKIISKLNIAS